VHRAVKETFCNFLKKAINSMKSMKQK